MEFSSQRREMLLFLTTNMVAVTSRANQQFQVIPFFVPRYPSLGVITLKAQRIPSIG